MFEQLCISILWEIDMYYNAFAVPKTNPEHECVVLIRMWDKSQILDCILSNYKCRPMYLAQELLMFPQADTYIETNEANTFLLLGR